MTVMYPHYGSPPICVCAKPPRNRITQLILLVQTDSFDRATREPLIPCLAVLAKELVAGCVTTLVHCALLLPIAVTPLEKKLEQGGGMQIFGLRIVEGAVLCKLIPLVVLSLLVPATLQPFVEQLEVWWCSHCG